MPLNIEWWEVALRLVLTIIAGAILGFDRTARGRAAGIRTVMLVCLAASLSMIQANQLLSTTGKASNSFIVLDLMRFPLGILTGMGFIGAGAILRRGNMVQGVTTAATLWTATMIGLCIGGGQLVLGLAGLVLAMAVLCGLKRFELAIPRDRRATLTLAAGENGPTPEEFRAAVEKADCSIIAWSVKYENKDAMPRRVMRSEISWRGRPEQKEPSHLIEQLASRPGVISLRWIGQGSS